tara:strand:+ start:19 stop:471 length:453 start_codon:yes stop_codon:yes gene_type:complete
MEIEGYSNYLIYDDGKVWSKNRKKFMNAKLKCNGYFQLGLYKNNKRKFFLIHRLVALHYIDNPENKPEVDHIDRNKTNNNVSNLRWVTALENSDNKNKSSNTGEKYIFIQTIRHYKYYHIQKYKSFSQTLRCDSHSLQDAINLRDALLGD